MSVDDRTTIEGRWLRFAGLLQIDRHAESVSHPPLTTTSHANSRRQKSSIKNSPSLYVPSIGRRGRSPIPEARLLW
jgi:hypothetical protein